MTDFNIEPFWDDFEADNGAKEKNYMRILFRPGYAVQARELTQIQSILQNQIKQFGDHIFKDGSPVIGGQLSLDTSVTYIKIEKQYNNLDVNLNSFIGLTIFNTGTPRSRARVIQTAIPSADDRVLMIKYLRGNGFSSSQTITTAAGLNSGTGAKIVSNSTNFTGKGSTVTINEGVFYVNGFFVQIAPQTIVLDPYSSTPTFRIGLEIDEAFIDENQDSLLLDPAQTSFNHQAPGASRYKFNLVLAKRELDSVDDRKFFELLRVENGVITRQVQYPIYSELEKTFARRTYDESGNYTVKPFRINLSANQNPELFNINIEPGKAYVKGFEFETIGTRSLPVSRARTFQNSVDHNLSAYYGNRVVITDVNTNTINGLNFATTPKEVDLHCVSADQIALDGFTQKYYATRVGTAKLKNFDRLSGNDFYAYLVDIKFDSLFGAANTNSTSPKEIVLPPYFSSNSQSYVGSTITMIDRFPGQSRIIVGYDGTGKLAKLDQPFPSNPQVGDKFSISIPLSSTDSIVRANTTSFNALTMKANVAFSGRNTKGETLFEDSNFQGSVFELPNSYIRQSSDTNVRMHLRTIRTYESFTSNGACTITLGGAEGQFDFGNINQMVSAADIAENLIVIPVDGTSAGSVLDFSVAGRGVRKNAPNQISIYTNNGSGSNFKADVYVSTKLPNVETIRKVKNLKTSQYNSLVDSDNLNGTSSVIGYANVKVNLTNAIAWFISSDVINKTPGEKQSLYVSDVFSIKKIYDSESLTVLPNKNSLDITDRYILDSGQTDDYYNHSSIVLKPGAQPPTGQTAVLFEYFEHTPAIGYISATSYSPTLYSNQQIPIYKNKAGKIYNLRDCIDMRPLRRDGTSVASKKTINVSTKVDVTSGSDVINANTTQFGVTLSVLTPPIQTGSIIKIGTEERKVKQITNNRSIIVSSAMPTTVQNTTIQLVVDDFQFNTTLLNRPTDPIEMNYAFYLPRIDKVVVTKDKDFKIISGIPDISPEEPFVDQDMMEIYKLSIPAYTASLDAINTEFMDNRRYTMKDIADLDKRLKYIERFVSLKEKEKETLKNPPKSGNVDKPIYGMIVDDFDNLTVVDQTKDFAASIELGKLSCYKLVTPLSLVATDPDASNIRDKFVTLPYTEVEMAAQNISSNNGNTQVQTAVIAKGEGFVTLSPESDFFYSLIFPPLVTDISGRGLEINQVAPENIVLGIVGDGKYPRRLVDDLTIIGDYEEIFRRTRVNIPNPWSNPAVFEASSVVPIDLNHSGVYFRKQDELWTGKPLNKSSINTNLFESTWNEKGYITGGTDYNVQESTKNK